MSEAGVAALLPDVADPVAAPFWAGLRERKIIVQRCADCAELRYPPLARCPRCSGQEASWVRVSPTGTVWSYAVYHRALHPAFAAYVPYTVAVVDLDGGPRLTARVASDSGAVEIGDTVIADFEDVAADVTLLVWRGT